MIFFFFFCPTDATLNNVNHFQYLIRLFTQICPQAEIKVMLKLPSNVDSGSPECLVVSQMATGRIDETDSLCHLGAERPFREKVIKML